MRPATFPIHTPLIRALALAIAAISVIPGCSSEDSASGEQVAAEAGDGNPEAGSDDAASELQESAYDSAVEAGVDASADAPLADAAGDQQPEAPDAAQEAEASPCPQGMTLVGSTCMDLFEAPNEPGALPLVMFHFNEAESWCGQRGKRLCYDDEWTSACEGPQATSYPYGDVHEPGVCNDDKVWKAYNQSLLNGWPWKLQTDSIASLQQLFDAAADLGAGAAAAADHVQALYQGAPSGSKTACVGPAGVFDLTGNVEEWTRRRDGGEPGLHGNLKGRYWSEARTCQQGVKSHGDTFRFYEIGFRCCSDPF